MALLALFNPEIFETTWETLPARLTSFGYGPEEVYNVLAPMTNARGETYGYDVEEALTPAA